MVVSDFEVLQMKLRFLQDLLEEKKPGNLETFGISETIELEVRDRQGNLKERRVIK